MGFVNLLWVGGVVNEWWVREKERGLLWVGKEGGRNRVVEGEGGMLYEWLVG